MSSASLHEISATGATPWGRPGAAASSAGRRGGCARRSARPSPDDAGRIVVAHQATRAPGRCALAISRSTSSAQVLVQSCGTPGTMVTPAGGLAARRRRQEWSSGAMAEVPSRRVQGPDALAGNRPRTIRCRSHDPASPTKSNAAVPGRAEHFNISRAVCRQHPSEALALIVENGDGGSTKLDVQLLAAQTAPGVAAKDQPRRPGRRLPQPECRAHDLPSRRLPHGRGRLAALHPVRRRSARYRLSNADASALITDMTQLPKVLAVRDRLPHLETLIVIGAGAWCNLSRLGPLAGRRLKQLCHRRHARRGSCPFDLHRARPPPKEDCVARPSHDAGLRAAGRAVA